MNEQPTSRARAVAQHGATKAAAGLTAAGGTAIGVGLAFEHGGSLGALGAIIGLMFAALVVLSLDA